MKKIIINCFRFLCLIIQIVIFCSCESQPEIVSVTNKNEKQKLTLMIYMAADNDLETYALQNLKMLEQAEFEKINVIVLLDRAEGYDETDGNWTDTRLYEVQSDKSPDSSIKSKRLSCPQLGLSDSEPTELDMSNLSVLKNFIDFCETEYEAEKYALIIWGHGSGWKAVTIDDRSNSYMSVTELGNAVRNKDLCVIGFDTCFAGVLENLYEIQDCAEYTIACPGVTPNTGWNYTALLETLYLSTFSESEIACCMAESSPASVTVFENSKIQDLFNAFEDFSKTLAETIIDSDSQRDVLKNLIAAKSYCYNQNPCDVYLDVYSLADIYSSDVLKNKLKDACFYSEDGRFGLGVHFIPKSSSGAFASSHSIDYLKDNSRSDQCMFIKESLWWVPTREGKSGSLLDKLFYISF